jgi:hypothetical protein
MLRLAQQAGLDLNWMSMDLGPQLVRLFNLDILPPCSRNHLNSLQAVPPSHQNPISGLMLSACPFKIFSVVFFLKMPDSFSSDLTCLTKKSFFS